VLGLLGPNGAGKTTAVRVLATLIRPDAGHATVGGYDVVRQAHQVRSLIGLTGQYASVDETLTGTENLLLIGRLLGQSRRDARARAGELLTRFNLDDAADRAAGKYSGGMRRRLDLAAALIGRPRLLFLDEPTTGLDPAARRSLWELVRGLQAAGRTILLTTHYMEEAEVLCDRLAIMDHGRILEMGTVNELISKRFHERAVRFDRVDSLADTELAALPSVSSVRHDGDEVMLYTRDVAATIGAFLDLTEARGVEPHNLGVHKATLEDVFLDLTGRALRD
jgi:oleandomycin transport system ATP-binding protein